MPTNAYITSKSLVNVTFVQIFSRMMFGVFPSIQEEMHNKHIVVASYVFAVVVHCVSISRLTLK